jgi:hypothetical protein
MVITRQYAAKHNIQLNNGLQYKKKNKSQNDDTHYVFRFLMLILIFTLIFTTSNIVYHYLFEDNKKLYNFIITDLPEKTIVKLYNNLPARPYNYFLDMIQDYNIDYF